MTRALVRLGSLLLVSAFVMFALAVGLESNAFIKYAFIAICASFFAYVGAGFHQMIENDRRDFKR